MEPIRLIIVAVGGQGNLLAARVLGEAALASGLPVRMSEIHGMAQRGGVVESSMVFGQANSSIISDGEADILLGFEPAEALRAIKRARPKTLVITNTHPLPPFTAAIGRGKYPEIATILDLLEKKAGQVVAFDAMALARQAQNPLGVNMVLLGALIQKEQLPLSADMVKETIRTTTKKAFVDANIRAFDLGFDAAAGKEL